MTSTVLRGLTLSLLLTGWASIAQAREDVGDYAIDKALAQEAAKEKLPGDVQFFFGKQSYPEPVEALGTYRANKKTNAFNKSDEEACEWAFLSAMISLRDRALMEGGNAVVDIQSNYDNNLTESKTTFKCGAGAIMAGVALQGRVVKLPE